jgi:hypothetical protein
MGEVEDQIVVAWGTDDQRIVGIVVLPESGVSTAAVIEMFRLRRLGEKSNISPHRKVAPSFLVKEFAF